MEVHLDISEFDEQSSRDPELSPYPRPQSDIQLAEPFAAGSDPNMPAVPPEPSVSAPRAVRGSAYLHLPRAPETWLLEPVLPSNGSMLLYGDPKVGKSFAALQLAAALASGSDWLGFRASHACRVLYIQLDTPRSLWADRVGQLGLSGLSTDAVWFADRETLGTWPFDILDSSHQVLLAETVASLEAIDESTGELVKAPADVVIMDTLRECHRGDENDATDMQNVVSHLTAAVKPAALIMVAHGRKASPERGSSLINDNRGSNYVVGAVDAIAHMTSKGLEIGGRAIDETFVRLERQGNGTWELEDRDRVKALARELLETSHGTSLREKAKLLSAQSGRSHGACLSILQRLQSE